jgi:peptide-methionine (S)-S-oxide reductase
VTLPDPALDEQISGQKPGDSTIVLAGGCFWGVQAVFQHVKGVTKAVSGYAGGEQRTAQYELVSGGETGHAESVEVTYDPARVTLGQILKVYFSVAHNPTELNYQGPDHGTQYRSAIFYATPEQKKIAAAYIDQLNKAKAFSSPIVTTLEPLAEFYAAEGYHQDYARLHPGNPYIVQNDLPKVANLQKEFPDLFMP